MIDQNLIRYDWIQRWANQCTQFYLDKFNNEYAEKPETQQDRKERKDTIQELTASPQKIDSS